MLVNLDVCLQVSGRKFHVLLTSYDLLMGAQDRPRLSRIHWGGIVVDEGHRWVWVSGEGCGASLHADRCHLMLQATHLDHTRCLTYVTLSATLGHICLTSSCLWPP